MPEVGSNGRYTWLAQRATGDLKAYISQPPHPALCAGAKDFAEFYGNSLKQIQKRIEDVSDLSKKARAQAILRIAEALTASNAEVAPPAPPPPAAALIELIIAAVKPVVPPPSLAEIEAEKTALQALQRAKSTVIAAQVAAPKGDDPKAAERILATGRALRMIEAAAYADIYVARYRTFTKAVLLLPHEIQQAHARTCTCAN